MEEKKVDPEKDNLRVKMDVSSSAQASGPESHPGEIVLLNVGGKRYQNTRTQSSFNMKSFGKCFVLVFYVTVNGRLVTCYRQYRPKVQLLGTAQASGRVFLIMPTTSTL